MKEGSSIDRIISAELNDDQLGRVGKAVEKTFANQDFHDLKDIEKEKTPAEKEIIALCNTEIDRLRGSYGLPAFHMPEKNIHIIKADQWKVAGKTGLYKLSRQGIVISAQPSNTQTAAILFHEMTHFASYAAMEYQEKQVRDYRLGVEVRSRPGGLLHFVPMNEAVTSELTECFINSQLDQPLFADERQQTEELRLGDPSAVDNNGDLLFNDDTYYADVRARPDGVETLFTVKFSYPEARQGLRLLCTDLAGKTGQITEDLYQKFFRGAFNGNILPLAKIIDRTYGQGTFRRLGEQTTEPEFLETVKQILKK